MKMHLLNTASQSKPAPAWRATGLALALGLGCLSSLAAPSPVTEDLPMVGTDAHGHAYPGATVPFGMVQLSPDTPLQGWDACSGYHYSDSVINGFSHTHLSGTGCGCLGDILLMPTVGKVQLNAGTPGDGYCSRFSHAQEHATPGGYSVFLQDPKIAVDLTTTLRCGFHQYTFPAADDAHIILDLDHNIGNDTVKASLKVEGRDTISGYRISDGWGGRRVIYFVMQFSKPFAAFGIEQDGRQLAADARESTGKVVKAFVNYQTKAGDVVFVKVGISGTGVEGARKNLAAEIPGWDFKGVHAAAVAEWNQIFKSVQFASFDPHIQKTFYANLYLSCLAPVLFNDVDGSYRGYDHQNHPGGKFQNYSTFSIWDIYRAQWPLMSLLHPGRVNDMVQAMLAEYTELGQHSTPIWPLWGNETWCMIGYHSADMIAAAYLEGFRGFDAEAAYQALRDTAMQNRDGLDTYKQLGYVASTPGAAATSKTLEYSFDDWCIARMAAALGHADDAKMFYQRAANYRNVFDQSVEFFRGRKAGGQWRFPFADNTLVGDEYTEADAWQYAFAIQQDVPGMIDLYGGDRGFIRKLDSLFTASSTIYTTIPDISGLIGQDSQGDEQCHHVPYLYDYAGAPFETQQRIRQVMAAMYGDTPAGQCGNVDCGQMSAWYIFSALGFYPVNPDSGVFAIGSPTASKAVIHLDQKTYHGRTFTVIAANNSATNIYIQSATLNGRPLTRAWITRDEVTSGGTLRFAMGPQPNPQWGAAVADRPPATMPAGFQYSPLPAPAPASLPVDLTLPIRIVCGSSDPVGGFIPYPNTIDGTDNQSKSAVDTSAANAAPAAVYQTEHYGNDFTYTFPVPHDQRQLYTVRLHFAEIFDDGAGNRLENIYVGRNRVLNDFDIFTAAGGMNRALVKEYRGVSPNRRGNITIRVVAATNSPDQYAKISAIEILEQNASDSAGIFVIPILDGKGAMTIDAAAAPELAGWATNKLAPVLAAWYPKIAGYLPSPGYTAPAHFRVTIRPMDGVAYTAGTDVDVSSSWCTSQMNREAVGSLVHELVHVVQQYGNGGDTPGWLVEGTADYFRWFIYEPQSHGADLVWMRRHGKNFSPKYNDSYRITANFLNWVSDKYDANIVPELNAAMRNGSYANDLWKQHTGKTVEDLGAEWKNNLETQLAAPNP